MTRTQRTLIVAGAVAAIVIAANASQGAYFSQSWGWVALAFLVPTTVLLILDRVSVPGRLRIVFATFMGALGLWIALSTAWSISTSASVREVERMLVYVALALAVALVLRRGDGPGVFAGTFVGIAVISSYGLATRLFPDRFDTVEDPFNAYRLAEPLGYWNAFALLSAIGAILAVGVVAHARRAWHAARRRRVRSDPRDRALLRVLARLLGRAVRRVGCDRRPRPAPDLVHLVAAGSRARDSRRRRRRVAPGGAHDRGRRGRPPCQRDARRTPARMGCLSHSSFALRRWRGRRISSRGAFE